MAGGSLLALLDDIASILDDVSVMSKVAAKKTAGVLGDDLALNAQQVSGVSADRELPVVWAVARGSMRNKAILVPAALAISAWIPWAVTPLLMIGGAFLCFEGFEKLAHRFLPGAHGETAHAEPAKPMAEAGASAVPPATGSNLIGGIEKEKIKGAIRTDFILSAEIIVIALGTVAAASFGKQVAVLCAIAIVMTVGVYGLVAGIVKLDDAGLYLSQKGSASLRASGRGILWLAPWLMKALSVAGTIAMFLVGGGILVHGLPIAHHWVDAATGAVSAMAGAVPAAAVPILLDGLAGIVAGAVVMAGVAAFKAGMRALRPAVG